MQIHTTRAILRVRKLCVNVGRTGSKQSNFIPLTHCCTYGNYQMRDTIDYKNLRTFKIEFT